MVINQKCNCCEHEPVCGFKDEYLSACDAVKMAAYITGKAKKRCDVHEGFRCFCEHKLPAYYDKKRAEGDLIMPEEKNLWLEKFEQADEAGKLEIIYKVAHLATMNSVSKDSLRVMFCWLVDYALEQEDAQDENA